MARSDHNSPFAHLVCCMDPLRLTVHKIYSQHAPTKLPRVDGILGKHEGHGQLLLCALIFKYNLSLVSVLSVLEGKSSGVLIGTGPRLCLSPAVVLMGTGQQNNTVEATSSNNKREQTEENLHDTESGVSGTNWWYLDARRCRRCGLITDPPHWGNECGTEHARRVCNLFYTFANAVCQRGVFVPLVAGAMFLEGQIDITKCIHWQCERVRWQF